MDSESEQQVIRIMPSNNRPKLYHATILKGYLLLLVCMTAVAGTSRTQIDSLKQVLSNTTDGETVNTPWLLIITTRAGS
jgi:hypothetical protein